MKKLIVSLFLVNLLAITPARTVINEEETITLFNQIAIEIEL